jgi:hypothetical protein
MPRCFPPDPAFGAGRYGEQAVWQALCTSLPDNAAMFYSQGVVDGQHEREIDLLVAWPGFGIAVIEVKGGHLERDGGGQWWSVQGQNRRKVKHPFEQAKDASHSLRRQMRAAGLSAGQAAVQPMVALPHLAVDGDPVDLPRRFVVGRDDLAVVAEVVSAALRGAPGTVLLDEIGVEQLIGWLTADLSSQASLVAWAEENEQRVAQLTEEQVEFLDVLRNQKRLAVIGGAGTGKTWLALEQTRRLCEEGQSVALLCYSRGLGRLLERMTSTWRSKPAYVGLFHDLATAWGAPVETGEESDYWETTLPHALGELAAARPAAERFDAVVVDEAQDFGELWWPSLLQCLREPATGGVSVFMDADQRVFSRQSEPPIDTQPFPLRRNVRNTKRIGQVFSSLASQIPRLGSFEGPAVRFVQCASDDASDRADDAVDALLDEWDPGKIVLLTTKRRHNLQREVVDGHGWAAYWDDFFAEREVFYGHVLGFKGLERPCVVLAVNGFKQPERAREMLYVGLSRARTQLVVCGDLDEIASVGGEGVRQRLLAAEPWSP